MFHSISTARFPALYYVGNRVYCFRVVSEPKNQLFVQLSRCLGQMPISQK